MTSRQTLLRAFLFLVACPLVLIVAGPLTKSFSPQAGPLVVGTVTSLFTFLLTVLFVRWDGIRLRDVGASLGARTAPRLLFGFVVGALLVGLQAMTLWAGGHVHWVAAPHRPFGLILLAVSGYFALALREELAFRGYPLRRLESLWGPWGALLLITAIFTLEHAAGGWSWSRALLGPPAGAILFGMAALATRGLAVPVGIHAAFNAGQWFMGQKETAGIWQPVVAAGFDHQAEAVGYAAYLAGALLAACGFWLWWRRDAARMATLKENA